MKNHQIFYTIQKNFEILGISANQSLQKCPLNERILLGFVLLAMCLFSFLLYVFNEANSFMEYTQSVYLTGAVVLISFTNVIVVIQMKKLFDFIISVKNLHNGNE